MRRFALALALASAMQCAAASQEVGVVLLHGKWGRPQNVIPLGRQLQSAGYLVSTPEMPWSARRLYDADYAAALKEVEKHVRELRSRGARRVVVAGQSMGANAAVAYASSGLDVDGLVLMSPGHFPESGMGKRLRRSIDLARTMVAASRGADSAPFEDLNQGLARTITTTAASYLSYFDPEGLGASTRNIRRLPKPIPLFLAIGTQDPFYPDAKSMFDSAPGHSGSRYVTLEAEHADVPNVVFPELLDWLQHGFAG
jgi:esterase/lipase